ncbi:hypothetical protein MKW94_017931 [Papaver nudicaule]|uniref:Uncharacterized protein n=1 Tax=Papaver nudicaule TaxID=74823 RepID=A0AA41S1V4_PAPNU|nr:hypothetical protein [Papaver nudicaule]
MKIEQVSSKLLQPIYNGDQPVSTTKSVPLTVFDKLADDQHIPLLYAYKPPNPSNSLLEQGLRKVLSEYREWAGRFGEDGGQSVILLNDEGMRFIEASADCALDEAVPFTVSTLLKLNPSFNGLLKELALVQLTRFTCGSLVLSFSSNHIVADGLFVSKFMIAWAQACRGLEIHTHPLHDRNIFVPRNPYDIKFDHRSIEIAKRKINENSNAFPYSRDDLIHQIIHFTPEFIAKIKNKASSPSSLSCAGANGGGSRRYSTFECMVAHLWRVITRARGLAESDTTYVRISVNGRRRLRPCVPDEFFGNLVLWAFPETQGKNLFNESLSHTAEVIHDAVTKVNDEYFKSFIDFANKNQHDDNLMPKKVSDMKVPSLWPNLEVQSWLGFPFNEVDFGVGKPSIFMPSFDPFEGEIYLVPSVVGDGSIDVYVTLFQQQLPLFKQICYIID